MHHRPKVGPPLLRPSCLLLLLMTTEIFAHPAIPQSYLQQGNYLDKTQFQPAAQLQETIDEVQKILQRDPTLPRLTRGEIEELYEKVTRQEYEKSLKAGDMGRADSMRALMLVLPYNTDNNTEENLQELFTRPPVTKVVDSYTSHQPIQFVSHNPQAQLKTEYKGQYEPTTYKPLYSIKTSTYQAEPTTYHPAAPVAIYRQTPSINADFKPVTFPSLSYESLSQKPSSQQRFSSHYNAKNADFLKLHSHTRRSNPLTTTVKPVADMLESLGIVRGNKKTQNKNPYEDIYAVAESAPQAAISSYALPQTATSLSPKIKPEAYSSFKPLNIGEEIRVPSDVEGYLTRFGIVGGRKRKALKKGESKNALNSEQASEESEISTSKVPVTPKDKKTKNQNEELEKLLKNLKELESLNINPKALVSSKRPSATSTTSTTTTTTTTTTAAPATTASSLITHGAPMLIEPKKPRRRIDPNFDINFGASSNHQTVSNSNDELTKLLENLQQLEKLQINPENVIKNVKTVTKPYQGAATTSSTTTTAPLRTQTILNRFELEEQQQQNIPHNPADEDKQLQRILKELQALERATAKSTTTTSTSTTTLKPALSSSDLAMLSQLLGNEKELRRLYEQARAKPSTSTTSTRKPASASDLLQIQKLINDDKELERLYEAATASRVTTSTKAPSTQSLKISNLPASDLRQLQQLLGNDKELERLYEQARVKKVVSSTAKPAASLRDIQQLEKYLNELENPATTSLKPPISSIELAQLITAGLESKTTTTTKKSSAENDKLEQLFKRVQQLERLNQEKLETTTESSALPFLGFTSKNIKKAQDVTEKDLRISSNDFAQLQQLYRQAQKADHSQYGQVEISTAATASKRYQQTLKNVPAWAQNLVDTNNETDLGGINGKVEENDFVQLQKLLSKVNELERVKIDTKSQGKTVTSTPSLVAAPSQRSHQFKNPNETHVVYAESPNSLNGYEQIKSIINQNEKQDDLKVSLPVYNRAEQDIKPSTQSSSEELRDILNNSAANPQTAHTSDKEFRQYHELFASLEEQERNSYQKLQQAPMILKTVTKEPPRFVSTRKPSEMLRKNQQQNDLEELQKLLNNAQELEKLGVTLPSELSQQIEAKLLKTSQAAVKKTTTSTEATKTENEPVKTSTTTSKITTTSKMPETEKVPEKTVVFSLTTPKSLQPKQPKTTTESSLELPILSASKIIEDAIKRAAFKIGVPTEQPQGFQRRIDVNIEDDAEDDLDMAGADEDLKGDFSEMSYQVAVPEINNMAAESLVNENASKPIKPNEINEDLSELQRLIANLEELKRLNISLGKDIQASNMQYLNSFNNSNEDNKPRRQSETESSTPQTVTAISVETATESARFNFPANEKETSTEAETTASTTTSTTTTTENSKYLSDLADSFGGPDPMPDTPDPPPKPKNGFYFLADWNSFLEVGDGDDQVIVRFSPKIGDPRLFLGDQVAPKTDN